MTGTSDFTAQLKVVSDEAAHPKRADETAQAPSQSQSQSVSQAQSQSQSVSQESSSSQSQSPSSGRGEQQATDQPSNGAAAGAHSESLADGSSEAGSSAASDSSAALVSGGGAEPPNSIPVITDDQVTANHQSTTNSQSNSASASSRPTAASPRPATSNMGTPIVNPVPASAPASVPGIELGDEDLATTSAMGESDTSGTNDDGTVAADDSHSSADEDFFSGLHEDPRTSAMQIVDEAEDDVADETIYETRSAAERLEEILLDGKRVLDRREAAKLGGISTVSARKMWRALGMSQTVAEEKAYTLSDAHALRMWAKPVADGLIDQGTALSLARAIGQTTDRLVVWQMETLVDFLTEEKGLTDPEARRDALQVVEDMVDPLQKMLTYSWRRNLAEVMGRLNVNVSDGLAIDNRQGWYDSSMPLARAVGFIDLVSYTRLSQKMEPRQLANLVQEFQGMAYNIVATGGGRVIKTVGDEVFFAAETPLGGAEIAMTLMERVTAAEDLPQARVGFVWGRVLSRLGDIFGSSVNLAARLTAVADPGTIFTDEDTARVLSTSDAYVFERRESLSLHGLGETGIGEMKRGTAARMKLDLDDDEN